MVVVKKQENKMYFNEQAFQEMLVQYQTSAIMINGVILKKDEMVERKLVDQVQKIVNAIINQYKYYIFEDIDDLRQEGLKACFMNFMKFSPTKGTAFNYFSIITKIHLLNYTDRRKKHRNLEDVDECLDIQCRHEINYDMFFESLESSLFKLIDENFVGTRRKKYAKIAAVILDYLKKSKVYVSKSDLYSWAKSYGFKSVEIREFVKSMSEFYPEMVLILGVSNE